MSKKRDSKLIKSYSSSNKGAWFSIGLFIALILYFIYLLSRISSDTINTDSLTTYIIYIAVFLGLTLVLYFVISNAYRTSLNFYEAGLELKRGSSSLFSEWENLDRFGIYDTGDELRYGVFFREKRKPSVVNLLDKLVYGKSSDFINFRPFTLVPTLSKGFMKGKAVDVAKLRETEFGQYLQRFAPHLFE